MPQGRRSIDILLHFDFCGRRVTSMEALCCEESGSRVVLAGDLSSITVKTHILLGDDLVEFLALKFGQLQLKLCGQAVCWILYSCSSVYLRILGYLWQSFHVGQRVRCDPSSPGLLDNCLASSFSSRVGAFLDRAHDNLDWFPLL